MTRFRPGSPEKFFGGPFLGIIDKALGERGLTREDVTQVGNVRLTPLAKGAKKASRRPNGRSTTLTGGLGAPGEAQVQRPSLG